MKFKKVERKVKCSINKLMEFDDFLLEKDVNERSITHKLAEYMQQEFKDWDVDCEYNRMINGDLNVPKRINIPIRVKLKLEVMILKQKLFFQI
jgi:hypothetical protein